MTGDAKATLQGFLDDVGAAVMGGNFEAYADRIRLPFSILTSVASIDITTETDLRAGFDDFAELIRTKGVTEMIRVVMDAWNEGPDAIVGFYETNLIDGRDHVMPPFYSKMWLLRAEGAWKVTKIHNTVQDRRWPIRLDKIQADRWPPKELIQ
jgi:hypothetical protein